MASIDDKIAEIDRRTKRIRTTLEFMIDFIADVENPQNPHLEECRELEADLIKQLAMFKKRRAKLVASYDQKGMYFAE